MQFAVPVLVYPGEKCKYESSSTASSVDVATQKADLAAIWPRYQALEDFPIAETASWLLIEKQ